MARCSQSLEPAFRDRAPKLVVDERGKQRLVIDDTVIGSQAGGVGALGGVGARQGVVVTDSMEAQAVLARSGVAEASVLAVRAGADLVLLTGSASWNEVFPRLLEEARSDPDFRARVRASAARVLALKRGLLG